MKWKEKKKQQQKKKKKKKKQYEAARIVTGDTILFRWIRLLNRMEASLASRYMKHELLLFYKMQINLCPNYLSVLVPDSVVNISSYILRNEGATQTIHANIQLLITTPFSLVLSVNGIIYQKKRELQRL